MSIPSMWQSPLRPCAQAAAKLSAPIPLGLTTPIPVMTTRRRPRIESFIHHPHNRRIAFDFGDHVKHIEACRKVYVGGQLNVEKIPPARGFTEKSYQIVICILEE